MTIPEAGQSVFYPEAEQHMREIGVSPNSWTNRVMVGEALERGLEVTRGRNRRLHIRHTDGREYTWRGGFTSFNTPLSHRVTRHKDVSSRLLAAYGVAATENAVFTQDEPDRAWQWAEKLGVLVVKPVDGTHGRDVHVGVSNRDEFRAAFDAVARGSNGRVLVEKFYTGVEHRCLTVNGQLIAATRRRPAGVLGDGQSTVRQLVAEKNLHRFPIHLALTLDREALALLAEAGMTPDTVPPKGDRVYFRRASNIHQGGDAVDATDELSPAEVDLVERAARAIPGARLIGMDVLLPRDPGDMDARVIEVNPGPMISMHHYPWEGQPRNVAAAILDAMFPAIDSTKSAPAPLPRRVKALIRKVISATPGVNALTRHRSSVRRIETDGLRFVVFDEHAKVTGLVSSGVADVVIPPTVDGLPVTVIGRGAFKGDASVCSVSVPETVRTLGAEAFNGCVSLTSIELPPGIEVINARAFEGCIALREVHLPHRLRRIAARAFAGCTALEWLPHFVWTGPRDGGMLSRVLVESSLPVTLEYIGEAAFLGCSSLQQATIPYKVTSIKDSTFEGCTSLERLWLHSALRAIGPRAFRQCDSLTRVHLPAGTKTIGDSAFDPSTVLVSPVGSTAHAYAHSQGSPTVSGILPAEPIASGFGVKDSLSVADVLASPDILQGILDQYELRPPTAEIDRTSNHGAPADDVLRSRFRLEGGTYRADGKTVGSDVTLAMVGDLMCGFRQQRSALVDGRFDFSASFDQVKQVFARADLTIGNLETMFADSYPYAMDQLSVDDRPLLNAPSAYLAAMRNAGLDAVTNANNHVYDTGPKGVLQTLDAINRAELVHGGLFADPREPRHLLFEVKGIKIGVVAHSDPARQRMKQAAFTPEGLAAMASPLDTARVAADIEAARAAGAEFVLAYCHWGREYTDEISPRQTRFAQMVADAGADYVFGSHSHCPQQPTMLRTVDGRSVPIVYSGGNFISDIERHQPITRDTFVSVLTLTRDAAGQVVMKHDGYVPCRIVADELVRGHVRVVPTELLQRGELGYDPVVADEDLRRLEVVMGDRLQRVPLAQLPVPLDRSQNDPQR